MEPRRTDMPPLKIIAVMAIPLLAMPAASFAQGASKEAPGHEQKKPGGKPGDAKKFAPGQQQKKPGDAKRFAPGNEVKK
jgi:hypothetical protein